MATKNNAAPEMPSGFDEGGTPDVDAWYTPEKGSVITGKIVGHITMKGDDQGQGPRQVVLVETSAPCLARVKGENKGKEFPAGSIIGVSISHDIKEMLQYVENKGHVWLCPTEKKKLNGTKTMWKFKQGYKGRKAAPPIVDATVSAGGTGDDDDIPF